MKPVPVIRTGDPLPPEWTMEFLRSEGLELQQVKDELVASVRLQGLLALMSRIESDIASETRRNEREVANLRSYVLTPTRLGYPTGFAEAYQLPEDLCDATLDELSQAHLNALLDLRLIEGSDQTDARRRLAAERAQAIIELAYHQVALRGLSPKLQESKKDEFESLARNLEQRILHLTYKMGN